MSFCTDWGVRFLVTPQIVVFFLATAVIDRAFLSHILGFLVLDMIHLPHFQIQSTLCGYAQPCDVLGRHELATVPRTNTHNITQVVGYGSHVEAWHGLRQVLAHPLPIVETGLHKRPEL